MAVAFVGAKVGSGGGTTRPSETATDDFMIMVATPNGSTISAPSGWTTHISGGVNLRDIYVFSKFATAGETDATVFSPGGSGTVQGIISYRGVSSASPVDVVSPLKQVTGTSITVDSVSPSAAGLLFADFQGPSGGSGLWTVSGMTNRLDVGSAYFVDESVVSGPTGTRTGTYDSSTDLAAFSLVLTPSNVAPSAPTLDSPIGGATVDVDTDTTFQWTFSDPDSGDSQSAYGFRYRVQGTSTWTETGQVASTASQRTVAGGTFAAGSTYEWSVRTYDSLGVVGPWATAETFVGATTPTGHTITDPSVGATISSEDYTVLWSTPDQDAYQLRRVADSAGSPDTGTVYSDTGTVESAVARSRSITFDTNGRDEHVQLRVRVSGLWSAWVSVRVSVSYTVPATPTVAVDDTTTVGAIRVRATHPAPSGSEPTVESVDVYRRVTADGGDGIRVATGVFPSAVFFDWAVASGVGYSYRVRAFGDNGASVYSLWSETATEVPVTAYGGY